MSSLRTVYVGLSERFVCGGIWEIVRAVGGTVLHKKLPTPDATVVVIEKFTLGVKKFGALFAWARSSGRCCHRVQPIVVVGE
jgi:hypothetical protein